MYSKDLICVKPSTKKELALLCEIDREHFLKPWSFKNFQEEFFYPHSSIETAFYKGKISGFIVYRIFLDELHIFRICTVKTFAGKGIATALLKASFKNAENKAKNAFLELSQENTIALSFYKKNGFQLSGIRNNYYGQGQNALNMTKDLSGGFNEY